MTIKYLTRMGNVRTITTNNPAVFELLSLMGCKVISQQ